MMLPLCHSLNRIYSNGTLENLPKCQEKKLKIWIRPNFQYALWFYYSCLSVLRHGDQLHENQTEAILMAQTTWKIQNPIAFALTVFEIQDVDPK